MSTHQTPSGAATPHVQQLVTTLIKGFGVRDVENVRLTDAGASGNRDFFVVDSRDKLLSITRTPAFVPYWATADGGLLTIGRNHAVVHSERVELGQPIRAHFFLDRYELGHVVTGPWSELLSDIAGQPVRLVKAIQPSGGNDVHPVTLQSESSVHTLGTEADGTSVDPRRFRNLITLGGTMPFHEDTWSGQLLSIGTAVLRVGGPIQRCVAVQRHPVDGSGGVNVLRLINARRGVAPSEFGRGLNLGVYASVVTPGVVRVGDGVVTPQPLPDEDR